LNALPDKSGIPSEMMQLGIVITKPSHTGRSADW
jgi:hypothetical protein